MLEAMARGVPCIGTNVGGIPELLNADDMVSPDDPHSSSKNHRDCQGQSETQSMSERGLRVAESYSASVLAAKRREFYSTVKHLTALHYNGAPKFFTAG